MTRIAFLIIILGVFSAIYTYLGVHVVNDVIQFAILLFAAYSYF